jgi:RNA polymerase sigma factor (sigma-70 family)
MQSSALMTLGRDLNSLYAQGTSSGLSDTQLLERFATRRDEAAFAVLVRRHGPTVLGVCRRLLGNSHDAEDAFQATFFVLARKAASIARKEKLAGWLYAVARQTAKKARALNARKQTKETQVAQMHEPESEPEDTEDDRLQLLAEELARLPERYRLPIILCELEGRTHKQAGRELGWPIGTVSGRLSRGRTMLAERLSRRERGLSGLALGLVRGSAPTSVPPALVSATVEAAAALGPGTVATGLISARAAKLTEIMMRALMLKKLTVLVLTLTAGLAGGITSFMAFASSAPAPAGQAPASAPQGALARESKAVPDRNQAKTALDMAIKDVDSVSDLRERCWLLIEIARAQARAGLWDDLRQTQQKVIQAASDTEHAHRLIDAAQCLAETGDVIAALGIANGLQPEYQRQRGLAEIASAQARAGDIDGARQTAKMIDDAGDQGIALHAIAKALAERHEFDLALQTTQTMASEFDKTSALVDIAAAQLRSQDPAFPQTLNQAKAAAAAIPIFIGGSKEPSDFKPNTLAQIAGILAESKAVDEARQVANSVTKPPWQDIAWKVIAKVEADRGEIDTALESTRRIQNPDEKSECLKNIVAAVAQRGDFAKASSLAGTIPGRLWRHAALLEVAKGQARSGQRANAHKVFEQILTETRDVRDGSNLGGARQASLFRLAAAQAELGAEAEALAWIVREDSPQIQAWALLSLAKTVAERHPAGRPPKPTTPLQWPNSSELIPQAKETREPIGAFRGKIALLGAVRYDDISRSTSRIEVINADGTGLTTIVNLNEGEYPIGGRVSPPDGKFIAFSLLRGNTAQADLWLVEPSGQRSKIGAEGWVSAWSPDGTLLACFGGSMYDWKNFTVETKTGRVRQLAIPRTDGVDDWSPDGKTLAVVAGNPDKRFKHPTKGEYPLRQIYLVKPDGTGRRDLTTGPMLDSICVRFSPDGKQLVYHERRHQDGRVLHFAVVQNRDGTGTRDLVSFNELYAGNAEFRPDGHPCWSPDGTKVAWLVPRKKIRGGDTRAELLVISVATGRVERIDLHSKGIMSVQAMDWR